MNAPASLYAFRCSACGRCCNSPPAMTVDELFHHAGRFVGCLAMRRDAHAGVALATQGHDYPSLGACPVRDAAGLCTIHHDRKPGMCGVVPLDPRAPAALQAIVLQRRHREATFLDADCIAPGPREGFEPLVEGECIVDAAYLDAFDRCRAALNLEDAHWGRDVLEWMRPELARRARTLTPDGYLALSLVPVLAVLSRRSAAERERCADYARRQVALIADNVARAVQRRHAADRPFTEELRRFASQYTHFVQSLERAPA